MGGGALYEFHSYRKLKGKENNKIKRNASYAFFAIALIGLSLSGYGGFDLILRDYVTQQGVYLSYDRGREIYIQKLFFSKNDINEFCYAFSWDTNELEIGKQCEFTYAKRTRMLISVEKIDYQ